MAMTAALIAKLLAPRQQLSQYGLHWQGAAELSCHFLTLPHLHACPDCSLLAAASLCSCQSSRSYCLMRRCSVLPPCQPLL